MNVPSLCDFHTCFESWGCAGKGQVCRHFFTFYPKNVIFEKNGFQLFLKLFFKNYSINANPEGEFTEMSYRNEKYPNCVPVDLYSNTSPP